MDGTEIMILSKISQARKIKYCMFLFICRMITITTTKPTTVGYEHEKGTV
jgi:hypothetical protein